MNWPLSQITWQATSKIIIKAGLRNEQFTNYNGDGQAYVSQRHQLAPRLGATWDVMGDSSLKVVTGPSRVSTRDWSSIRACPCCGSPKC